MKTDKFYLGVLVVISAVAIQACGSFQKSATVTVKPSVETQQSPVESPIAVIQNSFITEPPTPITRVTPPVASPIVTVTAVNGDLSIRTGPDISFDAIDKLTSGETVPVLARSIMDGWIQIGIPSHTGETGWISIQTNHSIVNGNLLDLPRIDLVEWNVGSYLRNCTPHQLIVKPGDKILQPVSDIAGSRAWFPPGSYSVYDLDMPGQPVVASLRVLAHSDFNILKDGDRYQWDCPLN